MARKKNTCEFPYLDKKIEITTGERVDIDHLEIKMTCSYFYNVWECGKRKFKISNDKIITYRCYKTYCPRCGGKNKAVHSKRQQAVRKRLGNVFKKNLCDS